MKHKMGFNPLSRTASHRKAMHRNMVTSLFKHERVTTTKPKALEVRRTAEKLITRSKVDTVHNRRQVARFIYDEAIVAKLFNDIGPRMKDRSGGYTRVLKLGFRDGDAAEMAILELVDYSLEGKAEDVKSAKKTAKKTEAKKTSTTKKAEPKKSDAKKADTKKTEIKQADTKKVETKDTDAKNAESKVAEPAKVEADKTGTEE